MKRFLLAAVACGLCAGCALLREDDGFYLVGSPYRINGVTYTPQKYDTYKEKGLGAVYIPPEISANGEQRRDTELTAAHKTLPLPSRVRITNLDNGNTAIVHVNDRGPFVNSRLIDVSPKTAEALEMPLTGTAYVQVELLPQGSGLMQQPYIQGGYILAEPLTDVPQDTQPKNARELYRSDASGSDVVYNAGEEVAAADANTYRIQVGVFKNPENAAHAEQDLSGVAPMYVTRANGLNRVQSGTIVNQSEAQRILKDIRGMGYADAYIINQ
ncbi:MAG: septal ring lytic transglycosylase RlpA family protein [Alphaproteobacteria bacterium]|nr:septal ring lytic transglycosylase RlpA family protein [Alphaproteobacteria bacterium]